MSDAIVYTVHPNSKTAGSNANLKAARLWAGARTSTSTKALETRLLYPTTSNEPLNALVSLGDDYSKKSQIAQREVVRKAIGKGVGVVKDVALSTGVKKVSIVGDIDAHAAAVGAHLALHTFTLKTKPDANPGKDITLTPSEETDQAEWIRGAEFANAQIFARELMELPGNLMTPTIFCERVKQAFSGVENVEIHVRDKAWAEEKGMNTFLSVAKGTSEPPKLLEIHYKGSKTTNDRPLAFVGKGITFDSGGISIKPSADMKLMRGDMGGAATVCASALAIAKLKIPIDLVVVTPLSENMPGPAANKPGDIIYAMNGKSIEIDNTDAEGRLVLSDAIYYTSTTFKPHTLIDVATLTGAMVIALGEHFSGVFSTSDTLWEELRVAGEHEHDRFWRMPLDDEFGPQIHSSNADLCNTGGRPGGSCTAALFLKAFVDGIDGEEPSVRWAHIDIAGSMEAIRSGPYQAKGMTGRPTRALIEFASRLGNRHI
ncbi:leucine aminopeptidase [Rickenella mellea]|uniref:leucyl aminopeptidase n=1 Tax=Rickenella mellea TaxID=50990 RepID=A0A4Y7PJM8_9AGAM|nr:leucine aminopeptidase [Rickenella mellea]